MKVILINNQNKIKLDLGLIEKISIYISNKFDGDKNCELNIIFAEEEEIKRLNKKYRNIDMETDVLSFSYTGNGDSDLFGFCESLGGQKGSSNVFTIGEIIICPEVAEDNVSRQKENWNLNLEIILLIIHGILHIYDYDHEKRKDKIDMENVQESILNDARSIFRL